jgi:hypothetical protein
MKKFRIKEVKNARVNSSGQKDSLYYPQVTNWLGLFRNIKPSEFKDERYKGDVIAFKSLSSAHSFINEYKRKFKIETPTNKTKSGNIIYHKVN